MANTCPHISIRLKVLVRLMLIWGHHAVKTCPHISIHLRVLVRLVLIWGQLLGCLVSTLILRNYWAEKFEKKHMYLEHGAVVHLGV